MFAFPNHLVSLEPAMICNSKKTASVIISVPHDFLLSYEDLAGAFKEKEGGKKTRDLHIWPIVKDIILQTGTKVSVVRGVFPRNILNYNQSPKIAYEDRQMDGFFRSYHITVESLLEKAVKEYGLKNCLLLDFHGFTVQPLGRNFDMILGTGHRKTIKHGLIDEELSDFFRRKRYNVFLPSGKTSLTMEKYCGGFTVKSHSEKLKINAIQLEIAPWFRGETSKEAGVRLSKDFSEFINLKF